MLLEGRESEKPASVGDFIVLSTTFSMTGVLKCCCVDAIASSLLLQSRAIKKNSVSIYFNISFIVFSCTKVGVFSCNYAYLLL